MMPPNRTVSQSFTVGDSNSTPSTINWNPSRCRSSAVQRTRTPFVYRGPTRLIAGVLYIDGELYGSDAAGNSMSFKKFKGIYGSSKTYEDFQIAMKRNMWRNPTPYTASKVEGMVNSIQASMETRFASGGSYYSYVVGEAPWGQFETGLTDTVPLPFDSGLEDRAVAKVLGKLKDQDVNLAVAFAERIQTVDLVSNSLLGLAKAARSLRKGNLKGVAEGLGLRGLKGSPKGRNFHEKWLSVQYGWKPLYQDVYGAVKALHEKDQEDLNRYMFTAIGSVKTDVHVTKNVKGLTSVIERVDGMVGCKIRLDYYVDNPLVGTLAQLGITNPAEVIWEIVPFSFVWDWFNPIGQYLSGIDAAAGKSLRGGTITNWSKSSRYVGLSGGTGGGFVRTCTGYGNATTMQMQRRVLSSFPSARFPGFKNPFPGPSSPAHLQNLVALFASSAEGRKVARI